jgi:hypothetical protein
VQREPEIEAAALVAFAGMDAIAFVQMSDPLDQAVVQAAAERCLELQALRDKNLAVEIANNLGQVLGG